MRLHAARYTLKARHYGEAKVSQSLGETFHNYETGYDFATVHAAGPL